MKNVTVIGKKNYKSKKDTLTFYKNILNSYKIGEVLNGEHFNDLLDLLDYNASFNNEVDESGETELTFDEEGASDEKEVYISDIRIGKVQFNTKCFEVVYSDSSSFYISYIQIINRPKQDPDKFFNFACRNAVVNDIRELKQKYFDKYSKKGLVKCQETGALSKWEDLVVDHRQPHTFSVIVDRFKELNKIETSKINYITNDKNLLMFEDENLLTEFIAYHKIKANLRIVKKENNVSRSGMGRIKQTSLDLKIE